MNSKKITVALLSIMNSRFLNWFQNNSLATSSITTYQWQLDQNYNNQLQQLKKLWLIFPINQIQMIQNKNLLILRLREFNNSKHQFRHHKHHSKPNQDRNTNYARTLEKRVFASMETSVSSLTVNMNLQRDNLSPNLKLPVLQSKLHL